MEIVIDALIGLLILAAVAWALAMRSAAGADYKAREREDAGTARERKIVERERRMRGEKIPLRCAGCDLEFVGPLTDFGCPRCHSAALVVPDDEYREIRAQSAFAEAANRPAAEIYEPETGGDGNGASD